MSNAALVIRPTAVFNKPFPIVAGNIIVAPRIIPLEQEACLFLSDGSQKHLILGAEMTTSPEALRGNLHGFRYSGDIIEEEALTGDALISNLPYHEALALYRDYLDRHDGGSQAGSAAEQTTPHPQGDQSRT